MVASTQPRFVLVSLVAFIAVSMSTRDVAAQPPFPTINISEPADDAEFMDGDSITPSGVTNQPGAAITLKFTLTNSANGLPGETVDTRYLSTDPESGNWIGPTYGLVGPGLWKVEVFLTNSPTVRAEHSGTVTAAPGGPA